MDGWFDFARTKPFPTIYPEWKTPVTQDVLEMGYVAAMCVLIAAFCSVFPADTGLRNKLKKFLRVALGLLIGISIMLCNFGQEWEVGHVDTHTFYKAGSHDEIDASIGVKIGLRSVNITLKADTEKLPEGLEGETINYNERFTWAWAQGRSGFGPFAGRIQREYRAAQFRGTPLPILWVAEYFTFDGEGIRFGRHYRSAGWYAHICVWLAFPMWILSMILLKMVVQYGAVALATTGSLLVTASIIWVSIRNFIELNIPFNDGDFLSTKYGIHWHLSLWVGCICVAVGVFLYFLAEYRHDEVCEAFGIDPLLYGQEDIVEEEELEKKPRSNDVEMSQLNAPITQEPGGSYIRRFRPRGSSRRNWKERSHHKNYQSTADNRGFQHDQPSGGGALLNIPEYGESSGYQQGYESNYPQGQHTLYQGYQPDPSQVYDDGDEPLYANTMRQQMQHQHPSASHDQSFPPPPQMIAPPRPPKNSGNQY